MKKTLLIATMVALHAALFAACPATRRPPTIAPMVVETPPKGSSSIGYYLGHPVTPSWVPAAVEGAGASRSFRNTKTIML